MPQNVRTHTRKDPRTGKTQTVRRYKRRGPNPGHALKMGKRAFGHGRKGRKGLMVAFGLWMVLEFVLWITFNLTGAAAGVLGALLLGLAVILTNNHRSRSQW